MPAPFRRPASLSPAAQDMLPGEPDPALTAELAHRSAAALLSGVRDSADPAVVERVLTLVADEGLEDLAALWSAAAPTSLPGALWRLYVLHTWASRDPEDVLHRYRQGTRTVPGLRYLAGMSEPPDVAAVQQTLDEILRGAFTGDLAIALGRAGAVTMLIAYGSAHLADQGLGHTAQSALTSTAERLLSTGEELAAAARLEADGRLD